MGRNTTLVLLIPGQNKGTLTDCFFSGNAALPISKVVLERRIVPHSRVKEFRRDYGLDRSAF